MSFEDKELNIYTKVTVSELADEIVAMGDDKDILMFILEIDKRVSDHDFSMDLLISLIKNIEIENGDRIKIRNALMKSQVKEGKQCIL